MSRTDSFPDSSWSRAQPHWQKPNTANLILETRKGQSEGRKISHTEPAVQEGHRIKTQRMITERGGGQVPKGHQLEGTCVP